MDTLDSISGKKCSYSSSRLNVITWIKKKRCECIRDRFGPRAFHWYTVNLDTRRWFGLGRLTNIGAFLS